MTELRTSTLADVAAASTGSDEAAKARVRSLKQADRDLATAREMIRDAIKSKLPPAAAIVERIKAALAALGE